MCCAPLLRFFNSRSHVKCWLLPFEDQTMTERKQLSIMRNYFTVAYLLKTKTKLFVLNGSQIIVSQHHDNHEEKPRETREMVVGAQHPEELIPTVILTILCVLDPNRGVARNSFWVGIIFTARYYSPIYYSSLTTSAAISAQNNFQGLILGGYIYRYTPPSLRPWIRSVRSDDNTKMELYFYDIQSQERKQMTLCVHIGRSNVTVICGHITISMLLSNTAYCVIAVRHVALFE